VGFIVCMCGVLGAWGIVLLLLGLAVEFPVPWFLGSMLLLLFLLMMVLLLIFRFECITFIPNSVNFFNNIIILFVIHYFIAGWWIVQVLSSSSRFRVFSVVLCLSFRWPVRVHCLLFSAQFPRKLFHGPPVFVVFAIFHRV
jgi:hypothetical protein